MPPGEDLATLSLSGATLVLHLAAAQIDAVVPELIAGDIGPKRSVRSSLSRRGHSSRCYTAHSPASPIRCTPPRITRTAVIIVGDVLAADGFTDSYLYSPARRTQRAALMRVLLLGGTAEARDSRSGCTPTSR